MRDGIRGGRLHDTCMVFFLFSFRQLCGCLKWRPLDKPEPVLAPCRCLTDAEAGQRPPRPPPAPMEKMVAGFFFVPAPPPRSCHHFQCRCLQLGAPVHIARNVATACPVRGPLLPRLFHAPVGSGIERTVTRRLPRNALPELGSHAPVRGPMGIEGIAAFFFSNRAVPTGSQIRRTGYLRRRRLAAVSM